MMKFDKETVAALVVGAIILFGWEPFCRYMGWFQVPSATPPPAAAPALPSAPAAQTAAVPPSASPAPHVPSVPSVPSVPAPKPVTLANSALSLTINPVQGSVTDLALRQYKNADRKADVVLTQNNPYTFGIYTPGNQWSVTRFLKSQSTERHYILDRQIKTARGESFAVAQSWELSENGYTIRCSVAIGNNSKNPVTLTRPVFGGGELAPWTVISGDKVRAPSHRLDYMTVSGSFNDISADADEAKFSQQSEAVEWAGVGNKYFCMLLDAPAPFLLYQNRTFVSSDKDRFPVIRVGAEFDTFTLAPGEVKKFEINCYAGPKIIADLEKFNPTASRVMHLSWGPLDYLARLLLWVLVKLHAFCGSYGWSIVILTLLVRFLFYPATLKANASMKKMQVVQPKLKELREKYKDNPQLLNTKMMELYKAEGVNPLGGCLPILLQLPVFFALYSTLEGAVQLRQVPFLWCSDLAAPDTIFRIPLHWFSLPVNPLVLAMTGLMVIQQHITPMAMDPLQKKMMTFMPVVMLVLLYDLPSGLTLYWTVSNIFSIVQLLFQNRSRIKQSPGTPESVPAK